MKHDPPAVADAEDSGDGVIHLPFLPCLWDSIVFRFIIFSQNLKKMRMRIHRHLVGKRSSTQVRRSFHVSKHSPHAPLCAALAALKLKFPVSILPQCSSCARSLWRAHAWTQTLPPKAISRSGEKPNLGRPAATGEHTAVLLRLCTYYVSRPRGNVGCTCAWRKCWTRLPPPPTLISTVCGRWVSRRRYVSSAIVVVSWQRFKSAVLNRCFARRSLLG